MKSTPTLVLLALICLATTIAPAIADTAKEEAPKSRAAILIDRLRADAAGAKLEAAFKGLHGDFWQGAGLYFSWTGHPPSTLEEIDTAGFMCFTTMSATGEAMPIVAQVDGAEPIADHLYLRIRDKEGQLLILGADGDPLAPLISSTTWGRGAPMGAVPALDWQDAMLMQLRHSIQNQLSTYVAVYGALPQDWSTMQTLIPLTAHNHRVLRAGETPQVGLAFALDSTLSTIRVTRFPDLGYGTVRYLRVDSDGTLKWDPTPEVARQTYRDLYVAELLPIIEPELGERPPSTDEMPRNPLRVDLVAQELRDAVRIWPYLDSTPESQIPLVFTFLPRRDDGSPYSVSVATGERVVNMPKAECVHLSAGPGGTWMTLVQEELNGAGYALSTSKPFLPFPLDFSGDALLSKKSAGATSESTPFAESAEVTDKRVLVHLSTDGTPASARQRIAAIRCATLLHLAGIARGTAVVDWNTLLAEERLIPMAFSSMPLDGALPTDSRNFEVARLQDASIFRLTLSVLGVGQGATYITCMRAAKNEEVMWRIFDPEDFPHLIAKPWIPVVRGELLPIPDPPALPEVTTP